MKYASRPVSSAARLATLMMIVAVLSSGGCELVATVDRSDIDPAGAASSSGDGGMGAAGTGTGMGGSGATGGGGSNQGGGGAGGGCASPSDCPGTDTDCQTRSCNNGVCGFIYAPSGQATQSQTPSDCLMSICDGQGMTTTANDDTDVLDDGNPCTDDLCNAGSPVNMDSPAGTMCSTPTGTLCDGSGNCVECLGPGDCLSGVCQMNNCVDPTCADQVKNGQETDVDCGGPDCNKCDDLLDCNLPDDCKSGVCTAGKCEVPTCMDMVPNGSETDVDCGGGTCPGCGPGLGCNVDTDCIGGSCSGSICLPTCTDGVKNANETDVDCGGPLCSPCADGLTCAVGADCTSGVCAGGICQIPSCTDGVKNGIETGTDCGGGTCPGCADGGRCLAGTDCASGVCTGGTCQVPACTDMTLNGSETDVDCGGGTCPACGDGKKCAVGTDCTSQVCTLGLCAPPTCGDGIVNGMEQCDDANMDNTDNCLTTCVFASCGDGFVHAGVELCDDGNMSNGDACLNTCVPATCGDGYVYVGMEACDDGNMSNTDACLNTCIVASCGDGYVYGGVEQCDDANLDNTDACLETCLLASCGDGYVYAGVEECDDLNTVDGDCCSSACGLEPDCEVEPNNTPAESLAGAVFPANGIIKARIIPAGDFDFLAITVSAIIDLQIETFEGFTPGACPTIDTEARLFAPNGMTELAYDDDDSVNGLCSLINPAVDAGARHLFPGTYYVRVNEYGNNATIAAYGVILTITATCGNSIVEGSEECDGGPSCDPNCDRIPVCGDGFIDTPETCDDANLNSGDGCDATCAVEPGYICSTVVGTCIPICGDTTTISPETCDDGNQASGDGCDNACMAENALAEVEPNDTFVDADARALDATPILISGDSTTLAGSISMIGDLDKFKMTLASDSVVRFETFDGTGIDCAVGLTTTLRLYNAGMTQIATDNITGIRQCSALMLNVAAGTYYVHVEEAGNNAPIAAYKLQVKIQASKGTETEPNDTQVSADVFTGSDVYLFGGHLVNADSDYFAIVVPAGRDVRAELIEGGAKTCESNTMDSRLTLFNALGIQLADDDDDGRGYCSLLDGTGGAPLDGGAGNLAAGTYFLRVAASSFAQMTPAGQFDYRLAVTIR